MGDTSYYIVQDDSMDLDRLIKGDLVIIHQKKILNSFDIFLVKVGSSRYLRRVIKDDSCYILISSNPNYEDIRCNDIIIIGALANNIIMY